MITLLSIPSVALSASYTAKRPLLSIKNDKATFVRFGSVAAPDIDGAIQSSGMPAEKEWRRWITNGMVQNMVAMLQPQAMVSATNGKPLTIVDIGCGPYPFYLKELAYQIYNEQNDKNNFGKRLKNSILSNIYAVDIDPEMLKQHQENVKKRKLVKTADGHTLTGEKFPLNWFAHYHPLILNTAEKNSHLSKAIAPYKANIIVASSIYHGDDKQNLHLMRNIFDSLAINGKVLFTHWKPGFSPRGPLPHDCRPTVGKWISDTLNYPKLSMIFNQTKAILVPVDFKQLSDGFYAIVFEKVDTADNLESKILPFIIALWKNPALADAAAQGLVLSRQKIRKVPIKE